MSDTTKAPLPRLTREQLLAATPAMPFRDIEVKALGGLVRVQGMTLGEKDAYEKWVVDSNGKRPKLNRELLRAKLIVRSLVDESGARLLKDEDIGLVGRWPAEEIEGVFAVCQELSALSEKDEEDLAKNSARSQPE